MAENLAQSFDGISIGDAQVHVISVLGNPVYQGETPAGIVLQYGSNAAEYASYVYIRDGVVVQKSLAFVGRYIQFGTYVKQYGVPQASYYLYAEPVRDSLRRVIHIWAKDGIAVTAQGYSADSPVIREDRFSPIPLETYMSEFGKTITGHETATVSAVPVVVAQPPEPAGNQSLVPLAAGAVVAVILLVFFAARSRRRRPQAQEPGA